MRVSVAKRIVHFISVVFLFLIPVVAMGSDDQGTIFVVRHGEKASSAADALLSAAGHKRANCLAQMLKGANVRAIFTPEVKRTQQTAEPLASDKLIQITVIPRSHVEEMTQKAISAAQNGAVLIVAQQDTMPKIVQLLGGGTIAPIGDNEFDRLVILHVAGAGATITTLHYCTCRQSESKSGAMR
ncbi:MAG TPA: phosphoglycerate mutase family protein [Terriglobales bacterium]|nr:phosphoglycerate mutase family protein [Terriglobales bacterium]